MLGKVRLTHKTKDEMSFDDTHHEREVGLTSAELHQEESTMGVKGVMTDRTPSLFA